MVGANWGGSKKTMIGSGLGAYRSGNWGGVLAK